MIRPPQAWLAAALLLAFGAPAPAASLSRLVEGLARAAADGPPGALGSLLEAPAGAADCLTPVLLAAAQDDGWEQSPGARLARPALVDEQTWDSPAGFRYHFTTRADSPHAPAGGARAAGALPPPYVERLDAALVAAVELLAAVGLQAPQGDPPWIDVVISDPGAGLAGYTVPGPPLHATFEEDRSGYLVLAPDLQNPLPAVAHQLAHLALLRYSYRAPAWWHEATAAWVGVLAAGDAAGETAAIRAHLAQPEAGPADDDLQVMRGALLFPAFLSLGESPPTSVAAVWAECAAVAGDNLLQALETVARDTRRGELRDLLRAYYASWVADVAGRSRLMAAIGITLPDPEMADEISQYPAAGTPARGPIAPLGAAFVHLAARDLPGGLSLSLEGDPGGLWDALLLVRSLPDNPFLAVPMEVDEGGRARVRFPWSQVSDAVLLAVNLSDGQEPARLVYRAQYRPHIPFDLIELSAAAAQPGARVRWTTDSETDLLGWNVYRSYRPGGPTQRLNHVLIPAAGGDRSPATYQFLDDTARGRKVYFSIEAVTVDGFVQRTQAVGTYLPSRR